MTEEVCLICVWIKEHQSNLDLANCAVPVEQMSQTVLTVETVNKCFNQDSENFLSLLLVCLLPWLNNATYLALNFMSVILIASFLTIFISPTYFLTFVFLFFFSIAMLSSLSVEKFLFSLPCLRGHLTH